MRLAKSAALVFSALFILTACSPRNSSTIPTNAAIANQSSRTSAPSFLAQNASSTARIRASTASARASTNAPTATIAAQVVAPKPTDAPTAAPEPTNTERPTRIPDPTDTERPSRTPQPTEIDTTTYYVTGSTANVRSCSTSTSTCAVLTALSWGDDIEVIEQVEGASVGGTTRWYRVLLNDGREGYIHGGLVSRTRPIAGSSTGGSGSGSGSSGGGSGGSTTGSSGSTGSTNAQPTEAPQQVQPTQAPAVTGYSCDCNKTCGAMTCEEAYFQLNTCGCQARDNDNDGVPCESVCSGG